ncbi:MAG: hypothetical protein MPL62_07655 [Alphaproteobacteria bacterium]|nr:hypothetical protein [Alphaproteobacteria bacterium]
MPLSVGRLSQVTSKVQIDKIITKVLNDMSSNWNVTYNNNVILISNNKNKVIIKTEIAMPKIKESMDKFESIPVIKVFIPKKFSEISGNVLRDEILKNNNYEYIIYTSKRYPADGRIRGTIHNIAFSVKIKLTPTKQAEEYFSPIEQCMNVIKTVVERLNHNAKSTIAGLLNQPEDIQTWRMAGLILSNAMVFHGLVSDKIILSNGKKCKSLEDLHKSRHIKQSDLINAWNEILDYNYNPIFSVAIDILSSVDKIEAEEIITTLYESSKEIRKKEMASSLDMYGKLLQKVIVDRDNLASYYTRPASAALISKLAIPGINHPVYQGNIEEYKIADFACGTGLLLTSAYRQLLFNYEASFPNKISINCLHKILMENCFIGLDVLPIATHLAVSSLAMMFPTEIFGDTKVKTIPIGLQDTKTIYVKKRNMKNKIRKIMKYYRLGSLDLIKNDNTTLLPSVKVVRGQKNSTDQPWSIEESHHRVSDESCNLIIMNPPFVRPTNHAGKHKEKEGEEKAAPAWAAFGASKEDQIEMGKLASKKFKETNAHGHAGLASYFIAVCDKKITKNGTMALIIPATISGSESWEKTRMLLKDNYRITVISIAKSQITAKERAFSSDTEMGEVMLIATKQSKKQSKTSPRGLFVSIFECPKSILDAQQIGDIIKNSSGVDKLETGNGGTRLRIGNTQVGNMLDCPIKDNWMFVNVTDPILEQISYKIYHKLPTLRTIGKMGPDSQMFIGKRQGGPFTKSKINIKLKNIKYPALWNNKQKEQMQIEVPPDMMLIPKKTAEKSHIDEMWNTASYVHININPRYTANRLIASYTTIPAIGGRTWPSVLIDKKYEKALVIWCNSTYGLLCYWSLTGKQQLGRGMTSRIAVLNLAIPNFKKMNKKDLDLMSKIYDKYHKTKLDRIKNLWKDEIRISIDNEIGNILNINLNMDEIRIRLCMEPSISGGAPSLDLIKRHEEII